MRLGLKTDDSATRVSFGSPAALVARLATRACCRCTDAAAGFWLAAGCCSPFTFCAQAD